ncbi:MAG: hypothetical protein AAGJ31_15405, partial [Verrucomicrobiota bacterium]
PSQGIDGGVILEAGEATTYSRSMRFEPKAEKQCLGFWTDEKDWAEWRFSVHDGGDFQMEIFYGCGGEGNAGSTVEVWLDDTSYEFTVEDTGGFQSWVGHGFGKVSLKEGEHLVAVKPKNKVGKAVLDVQKVVFTPVAE